MFTLRALRQVVNAHLDTLFIQQLKYKVVAIKISITNSTLSYVYIDSDGCLHLPYDLSIPTDLFYAFQTSLDVILAPEKQAVQDQFELVLYKRVSSN